MNHVIKKFNFFLTWNTVHSEPEVKNPYNETKTSFNRFSSLGMTSRTNKISYPDKIGNSK